MNKFKYKGDTPYYSSDFWHSVFLSSIRGLAAYKTDPKVIAKYAAETADEAVKQAQERGIVEKC